VAISGASGLIGKALANELELAGYRVVRLARAPGQAGSIVWDPSSPNNDLSALSGCAAVVHLAGENVASRRWNEEQKRRIRESRSLGTRHLCEALARLQAAPRVLVSVSGIGYYGEHGAETVDETTGPGTAFLSQVCVEWEAAADPARERGIRVVHPRIGLVLAAHGGALARMLPVFKLGAGGKLGSGQQYMSWISLRDLVRALRFAIESTSISGPMNAVAPNPVQNVEFTRELARTLGRPALFPVPAAALRLVLGELSSEVLGSIRVAPRVLENAGFHFDHPELPGALSAVLASES
jgi:uncharacterized protein (TIGR01777 family)